MLKNKKVIIYTSIIVVVLLIITIGIFVFIKNADKNEEIDFNNAEEMIDKETLEMKFNEPFLNEETAYVKTLYHIKDSSVGKYDIQAYIPRINIKGEEIENINSEIYRLLANSILNEASYVQKYTTYNIEYTSYVNNNILSLVIRATIKEGENPSRIIIKTYNYDMEKNERVELLDIINEQQKNELQEEIKNKIEEENKRAEQVINQGYNAYIRDTQSPIYKIENATEFFIGNDNILYIVYAYGNQNYTEELDLIMKKL